MYNSCIKKVVLILTWSAFTFFFFALCAAHDVSDSTKSTTDLQEKTHLCLTMIVKNESRIIERCLDSVKDIVDCISICDTGSTDNTIEIIEQFMQNNNIPGHVHRHAWKNFGHNRTLSSEAAIKTIEEFGFPLERTYLLLLDADMILEVGDGFNKNELKDDSYLIVQKNFDLSCYNTRLILASMPWECVGVTHEYWSCKKANRIGKLQTLMIDDHEDGGSKADKFERDIKLLTQGLKDEPDNERYMFYLAQSYKCLQQYAEAIRWFKARIQKGGWKEEVWYAKIMIGECYQQMGFWDHALHWYLEAYQYNPTRAETLQKIAQYYRVNGQNDLAYLFAKQGSLLPFPKDQILFISHRVYDYLLDEEVSVAAYYTPFKDEGFAAADRLAHKKDIPEDVKERTYKNLLFYVQNLKNTHYQPIMVKQLLVRDEGNLHYKPLPPSIQKTENGYMLVCSMVNQKDNDRDFKSCEWLDEGSEAKHFVIHYDENWRLLSGKEITESLRELESSKINCKQKWCLGENERCSQTRCTLSDTCETKHITLFEKNMNLKGMEHGKNRLLPLVKGHHCYSIDSNNPFIICKQDLETGTCENIIALSGSLDFSRFRGSTSLIEFDEGYLMLVHEVVGDHQPVYLHRFVFLDSHFKVERLSKPFVFTHQGFEYCRDIIVDHSGTKCIIPIDVAHRQAYLAFVDLDTIRSLLETLPANSEFLFCKK
jgi:glycosyltransferase involved in cell wall biosynthesis